MSRGGFPKVNLAGRGGGVGHEEGTGMFLPFLGRVGLHIHRTIYSISLITEQNRNTRD